MDTNENEDIETTDEDEGVEETSEPTDDVEALKARLQRLEEKSITQRERTRALKQELAKARKTEAPKEEKKEVLDRIDRAVLRAEKITAKDEVELVESIMKETGKSVEAVLESKYFKSELAAIREAEATKEATPTGTKRSGQVTRDEVDYWVAKGELPKDNPELARKVVNAKIAKLKSANQFSDQAVIS